MKGRPRRIEREVALHLSRYLATLGMGPVNRIPVLGRTGPDVDVLPGLQIAVDVKSRKANPKNYKLYGNHLQFWGAGELAQVGSRLSDLKTLFDVENISMHMYRNKSITVSDWLAHMSEWTLEQEISGVRIIPALVLHWPGTPVKFSTFLIYESDRSAIDDRRRECLNNLQLSAS